MATLITGKMNMAYGEKAGIYLAEASEFCTNTNCHGEVRLVGCRDAAGNLCSRALVRCDTVGSTFTSEPIDASPEDLREGFTSGDDEAEILLMIAVGSGVCCDVDKYEINNPNILFNGEPVTD